MNHVKSILRKARTHKGFTLKKVSQGTGIPFTTISSWERGAGIPNEKHRQIIADFYQMSVDELFSEPTPVAQAPSGKFEDYETRPVMLHKTRWELAEELRPQFDAVDIDELFSRLLVEAKKRPIAP